MDYSSWGESELIAELEMRDAILKKVRAMPDAPGATPKDVNAHLFAHAWKSAIDTVEREIKKNN